MLPQMDEQRSPSRRVKRSHIATQSGAWISATAPSRGPSFRAQSFQRNSIGQIVELGHIAALLQAQQWLARGPADARARAVSPGGVSPAQSNDQRQWPAFAAEVTPPLSKALWPNAVAGCGYRKRSRDQRTVASGHFGARAKSWNKGQTNCRPIRHAKAQFKPGNRPYSRAHSDPKRISAVVFRDPRSPSNPTRGAPDPNLCKSTANVWKRKTRPRFPQDHVLENALSADRTIAIEQIGSWCRASALPPQRQSRRNY